MNWLETILSDNQAFRQNVAVDCLPTERQPWPYAVVTCMDPRVNLAAAGIPPFEATGELRTQARVIRTLGGMADPRSLLVGIHLAGFKEIAILMHTDCGCSVAYARIDTIIENMQTNLSPDQWQAFTQLLGEPLRDKLREWLRAFQDPREAVRQEVATIKGYAFVPANFIVHGLLYDLASGEVEVIVNGYGTSA